MAIPDPTDITNWLRLDGRTTTSGQPTETQLAQLAALGARTVINLALHTHERALADEAGSVAALGMAYVHIPVDFKQPREVDFDRFCQAMAAAEPAPVHVHCIMNWRVSAFFCRYQRDVQGVPEAAAQATMEQVWQPDPVWAAFVQPRGPR